MQRVEVTDLFGPVPKRPRAPRMWRMHVFDAGDSNNEDAPIICIFECARCGSKSEWTEVESVQAALKGIPCPTCNGGKDADSQN